MLAGLGGSSLVPLDHEAIKYGSMPTDDPVARLEKKLVAGDATLSYDETWGFLPSVLDALEAPVESQILVFAKTSFQAPRISPRTPRALYFNDRVSVGWVRGGDVVELAAVDPRQGVIFYTLDQDPSVKPHFERRDTCLQCHASGGTLGVPGLMVRSIYPERSGMPLFHAGGFVTDHRSPLPERWGGWYVTGSHGETRHMGNAIVPDRAKPNELEQEGTQNLADLSTKLDTAAYLSKYSDIVALMVLEHQTHMTNLITRVGYEARMAVHQQAAIDKALGEENNGPSESTSRRVNSAVEEMLQYMLFVEEAELKHPVSGTSGFAEVFQKSGARDDKGRSLRDLDLKTRLFLYPCSFMIYSEAFDNMPAIVRERLYHRLQQVLSGEDKSPQYSKLSETDRKAILEILKETKPEFAKRLAGAAS
jgi:hypothetical protein